MGMVPGILAVEMSEVGPAAVPIARWQARRHQRLTCRNIAASAGNSQGTLKDVPVELQGGHAPIDSGGEGNLVARRRQQAKLLTTNGRGTSSAVDLGLVLVNRHGGQVSCCSDEGGHIEDMVFCREAKRRGVSD